MGDSVAGGVYEAVADRVGDHDHDDVSEGDMLSLLVMVGDSVCESVGVDEAELATGALTVVVVVAVVDTVADAEAFSGCGSVVSTAIAATSYTLRAAGAMGAGAGVTPRASCGTASPPSRPDAVESLCAGCCTVCRASAALFILVDDAASVKVLGLPPPGAGAQERSPHATQANADGDTGLKRFSCRHRLAPRDAANGATIAPYPWQQLQQLVAVRARGTDAAQPPRWRLLGSMARVAKVSWVVCMSSP